MSNKYNSDKFNYRKKFVPAGFKDNQKKASDAKKRETLYTESWDSIRKRVYQRDGNRCVMCGNKGQLHAHHIVPVKISKDNSLNNLVSLCNKCHRKLEEIGFSILQRGGGQSEVRRTELFMIMEAKKQRAKEYMEKVKERNNVRESGDSDKSTDKDCENAERNEGYN